MQLARVLIENFRQIERLEVDFTDSLDRVRDVTLLVGPNGSGKTTLLDAIAAALGPTTELPATRTRFKLTPPGVVRQGALSAKVTCSLRFTDDEIEAARDLYKYNEDARAVPTDREVQFVWTYPDPSGKFKLGTTRTEPWNAWMLLKARVLVARLLRTKRVNGTWFKRAGQIITIDQQRTSFAKTIRRDIWNIIHGGGTEDDQEQGMANRRTSDPREILLDFAIRSKFPQGGGESAEDDFKRIADRYAELCAPRRILGAFSNEYDTLDLRFTDGKYEYWYDSVSSGEAMVLLFLIKMVSERIHRSLVLTDEVELHQHPVWERRLLHLLPRIGESNQIIATTHSSYLRDVVPRGAVVDVVPRSGVIELGDLGDTETSESGAAPVVSVALTAPVSGPAL